MIKNYLGTKVDVALFNKYTRKNKNALLVFLSENKLHF